MHRSYLFLTLCVLGALAYRMDYDLKELQGWQYQDSECTKDIVIVLDTSTSLKNSFEHVKKFLQNLVINEKLNVKKDGTRIGLVIFNSPDKTKKMLDIGQIHDAATLMQYMGNLIWKNVGGGVTRTDMGLKEATKMFVEYKKNEPGRNMFGDVAIVVTDGKPRGVKEDDSRIALVAARALKDEGVLVIGAGVGNDFKNNSVKSSEKVDKLNKKFMRDMVTLPKYAIFEESFHNINSIIGKLVADSCLGSVPKCQCKADAKTRPFITSLGKSTVTMPKLDPSTLIKCTPDNYRPNITEKYSVDPALPEGNNFPVGKKTYNYTLTLDIYEKPLICGYVVEVKQGPVCGCSADVKTHTHLTELGKTTASIPMPDASTLFECNPDTDDPKSQKFSVDPPLPQGNEFPVGKETYKYTYNFTRYKVKFGPVTCTIDVEVRKSKQCKGKAYDPTKKVCCCGTIHDKQTGHACCGTEYYNLGSHKCCEGSTLMSANQICVQ